MFSSQGLKMRASVHREQSGLERDLGFPELSGEQWGRQLQAEAMASLTPGPSGHGHRVSQARWGESHVCNGNRVPEE